MSLKLQKRSNSAHNEANAPANRNAAPALQVTREQLDAWMAGIGFKPVQRIDDLFTDARWFVIYGRK